MLNISANNAPERQVSIQLLPGAARQGYPSTFVELRLAYTQNPGSQLDIVHQQSNEFAPTQSRCVKRHDCESDHMRAERRMVVRWQCRCHVQELRDLRRLEKHP